VETVTISPLRLLLAVLGVIILVQPWRAARKNAKEKQDDVHLDGYRRAALRGMAVGLIASGMGVAILLVAPGPVGSNIGIALIPIAIAGFGYGLISYFCMSGEALRLASSAACCAGCEIASLRSR